MTTPTVFEFPPSAVMQKWTTEQVRNFWATALESGYYEQTTGFLVRVDEEEKPVGYCCLGVLCDLYERAFPGELAIDFQTPENALLGERVVSFNRSTQTLPDSVMFWAGLQYDDGDYNEFADLDDGANSLAEDNDGGSSFVDIATTIREIPWEEPRTRV